MLMAIDALKRYSKLLVHYPIIILILTTIPPVLIPLIIIRFSSLKITENPELGFDTRDTEYSGTRLAWETVSWTLQKGNRVALPRREKRSWADDLLNAFGQVPCYEAPILGMDYLSQFVVETESYDAFFRFPVLKNLCSLHGAIEYYLRPFSYLTPYRNIWSFPNYVSCLSPNFVTNCTFLTEEDVIEVKKLVDYCRVFKKGLIACMKDCYECSTCDNIPKNCSSRMMVDLFYRILPRNLNSKPLYVNSFLPVFTLLGYRSRGINNVTVQHFLRLENALKDYFKYNPYLKLKGISMDIKRDILFEGAKRDSLLACFAAVCVTLVIFFYSLNILYCIAVAFMLGASVLCALAVYSFFTSDFPLLNLVIFVLLLAIGSDDAFLLLNSFPTKAVNAEAVYDCLSHTATAMLLTSSSTAVPFFINIFSSVVVFRCFGLFAGLTLIFNYLLEISFLPVFLILQKRYMSCTECFKQYPLTGLNYLTREILPSVIVKGRYVWVASLSIFVLAAGYISYFGLRFPEYNPLQLFINSNSHEWFDNNAERNFEFIENKIGMMIGVRLIWGLSQVKSLSTFRSEKLSQVFRDPTFVLRNTTHIVNLAKKLKEFRELEYVRHESQYWPERYIIWSENFNCIPGVVCCNKNHVIYNQSHTDYCIRLSTSHLYTQYNDTPIYDNTTFELVGYTASLPTKLTYSHRFANLTKSFDLLRKSFGNLQGGWYTLEWPLMCVWYDLLRSILSDCRNSVILSFAVVTVLALMHLHMMALVALVSIFCIVVVSVGCVVAFGWVIGVLEAVILVLVVGLSFDFTLHYGASVPSTGCAVHRVHEAAQKSAIPIALAALSSIVAGGAMLFAETHAFFQVGVFLVTSTSVSWLFATFFFLPLLSWVLPSTDFCKRCVEENPEGFDYTDKCTSL